VCPKATGIAFPGGHPGQQSCPVRNRVTGVLESRAFPISGEPRVDVDWRRLRAVVIESDDWGLCAWVPDENAHAALSGEPAFRSTSGVRYGRSTLETAGDVRELADVLVGWRGGDGFPPVLQANTVVANPDYDAIRPPFDLDEIPVVPFPGMPG